MGARTLHLLDCVNSQSSFHLKKTKKGHIYVQFVLFNSLQ